MCWEKEQWDSDDYLEGTTWSLYPWTAKLPRSPFMQVKWETNKYTGACNAPKSILYRSMECTAPESIYAEICNVMHLKVHMQGHPMHRKLYTKITILKKEIR